MVAGLVNAVRVAHDRQRRTGDLYLRYNTLEYLEPFNNLLKFMKISETGEAVHPYFLDDNPVSFEHKFQYKKFEKFSKKPTIIAPGDYYMNKTIEHFSKYLYNEIRKWRKDKERSPFEKPIENLNEGKRPRKWGRPKNRTHELGFFYKKYKTLEYINPKNILLSQIRVRENGEKIDEKILPFCPVAFDYLASWENEPEKQHDWSRENFDPKKMFLNNNFRDYSNRVDAEIMKFRKVR